MARIDLDRGFAAADASVWVVLAVAGVWIRRRGRPGNGSRLEAPTGRLPWIGIGVFSLIAAIIAAAVALQYGSAPHGHWDAWAIWNQKARFLVRDIDQWTAMQAISWSNPSHPFLVSLSVARLWAYAGSETTAVPALLSACWGIVLVLLVIGALGVRRWHTWVAASLVIAPAMFSELTAAQTADLPVSLFFLLAMVLLRHAFDTPGRTEHPILLTAAIVATVAAWTKNEGLLFTAVTTVVVIAVVLGRRRLSDLAWWGAGLLPVGFSVVWFKLVVAPLPPEYLTESSGGNLFERLLQPDRHALVLPTMTSHWLRWGGDMAAGILPLMMGAAVVAAVRPWSGLARPLLAILALMLCGYYAIWVGSALDTQWLVRTTFDRLLMQLWPSLVVVVFTADEKAGLISE